MVIAIAACAVAITGGAPTARAHAVCNRADPADGSTVAAAPDRVSCEFTEPPAERASTMSVVDHCGRRVDDGDVEVLLRTMSVGMAGTGPGRYQVEWETVSLADGHGAAGWFEFTVSGPPSSCAAPATSPEPVPTTSPPAGAGAPSATAVAGVGSGSAAPATSTTEPAGVGSDLAGGSDGHDHDGHEHPVGGDPAPAGDQASAGAGASAGMGVARAGSLRPGAPDDSRSAPSRRPELLAAGVAVALGGIAARGGRRQNDPALDDGETPS